MRLIDADDLKEQFAWREVCRLSITEINQIINDAPTIKPSLNLDNITEDDIKKFKMIWQRASKGALIINADGLQGEWIEDSGNIACSNCHTIWLYRKTDFCPNCGAKMKIGPNSNS